jgi:hypothetical protein
VSKRVRHPTVRLDRVSATVIVVRINWNTGAWGR